MDEVIEELVAPSRQRYTLSGFSRPFSWLVRSGEGLWILTPTDTGTHVRWNFSFTLTSFLAWPIVAVLLHVFFHRAMVDALSRIRTLVESEPAPGAPSPVDAGALPQAPATP